MQEVFKDFQQFVLLHREWIGPIFFLLAFGESLIFVGLFIPATAIMLGTGALIQRGVFDPWTVITWSIAGAILGDMVTYWIGRVVGQRAVRHWPLNRDPSAVAKARLFFRKYGFLSIFIGRFLGPVRSTIPMIAGMAKMRHYIFQIANVTSALVFIPAYLAPGYIFGMTLLRDLDAISTWDVVVVTAIILGLTVVFTWLGIKLQGRGSQKRRERRKSVANPNPTQS